MGISKFMENIGRFLRFKPTRGQAKFTTRICLERFFHEAKVIKQPMTEKMANSVFVSWARPILIFCL